MHLPHFLQCTLSQSHFLEQFVAQDYILRDRKDVLNVFIHADFEYRKNRVVSVYGQNEFAPDKRISNTLYKNIKK